MTTGTELGGRLPTGRSCARCTSGSAAPPSCSPCSLHRRGVVPAGLSVWLISVTGSLCLPALQTRLIDVAGDAQTLAAAGSTPR
jgi:hypothetical protein